MHQLLVILALLVISSSPAFSAEPVSPFETFVCEGNHFRARVPSAWMRSERNAPYADMTRVAGARFDGPPTEEGVPASIALYWYSGEKSFTTPESYINARLGSMVREDAERGRVTEDVLVADRKATRFQIKTFELVKLLSERLPAVKDDDHIVYERVAPSRKVIMEEQYIVIPAAKGFFVLHYRAPESVFGSYREVFDKVTASFEPQVP